jgi:hypothetical protein
MTEVKEQKERKTIDAIIEEGEEALNMKVSKIVEDFLKAAEENKEDIAAGKPFSYEVGDSCVVGDLISSIEKKIEDMNNHNKMGIISVKEKSKFLLWNRKWFLVVRKNEQGKNNGKR